MSAICTTSKKLCSQDSQPLDRQKCLNMNDSTQILDVKLSYVWNIKAGIVEECFKNCKKNDAIYSPIFNHPSTNTKWMLQWNPYGDSNNTNDNESRIYLCLIYKSGDIKEIAIKNKIINCKQINKQFVRTDKDIYDKYTGWGWLPNERYKVNELNLGKEITFEIKFNICNIVKNNHDLSIIHGIYFIYCKHNTRRTLFFFSVCVWLG